VITFLAFAFVLGVLVFVHELGHFLAAKRVGIKVLKFQLGFNPTILSFKRGDTEYGIGAVPLGGYVKMAGENLEDVQRDEQGKAVKRPDEFLSKSKWQRFQVLIMGPAMNLLLAVVLLAIVLYRGAQVPAFEDQPPVVGAVATGSPAEKAGIRPGDLIVSVADRDVNTWQDFFLGVGTRPNREINLKLARNGSESTIKVTPVPAAESRYEIGDIGVLPNVHPSIRAVNPGEPADKAGLKPNDVVLAVDGETITFSSQLKTAIEKHAEQPITLSISRNGVEEKVTATPARVGSVGMLGIQIADATKSIKPGPFQAIAMSFDQNVKMAGLIFRTVGELLTGQTSPKQLMGPVAIAQLSGESAQLGWVALISLMASISLNLGLLNLLPIPVLDGGHIMIMALEGVARRDFSVRVKEKMLLAGFVALMLLMVTVIYNDLTRISWIERLMPWR
jgi:regulator of sigma E protease